MSRVVQIRPQEVVVTDSLPPRLAIHAWEQAIDGLDGIKKVMAENQADFSALLSQEQDKDSYLTSPAYYAFTGRNGLWVYQEGSSFIPFCWHPNTEGQILVFPVRGEPSDTILQNLLHSLPEPPQGLRLARVKKDDAAPNANNDFAFAPIVENVLDWKYPVRVLSTERVAKMEGPDFRYIRNHVKHAETTGAEVFDLSDMPKALLNDFIRGWAREHSRDNAGYVELVALYQKILSFAENPAMKVHGFVVTMGGEVQALSMWDVSNPTEPTANRFVNLCNSDKRGLADFATRCLAERLVADGIKFVNIGGAETESLDRFKSKFMPAYSVEIHSVGVAYEPASQMKRYPAHPGETLEEMRQEPIRLGLIPG